MTLNVSVIIPAHNEEKIIEKSLSEILKLNYESIEILICLDGCTDNTDYIINHTIMKYNNLNKTVRILKNDMRLGKAETIMKLLEAANGEIIILNDADWKLLGSDEEFCNLIKCFEDPKIGGVHLGTTLSFLENPKCANNIKSILYLGNAWACILTTKYQTIHYTKHINNKLYADVDKMIYPFMIDIFRKSCIDRIHTTCDDGEFTFHILQKGYDIAILGGGYPRFEDMNRIITIKDLIGTKIRGEYGRKIIAKENKLNIYKFYLIIYLYFILHFFEVKPLRAKIGLLAWMNLTLISLIICALPIKKQRSSKDLWAMKVRRT